MNLTSGTRLGSYEILSPIGAGGMGEVYRARDLRLDREVAIKVLPEQFSRDADALLRFEREAKAVAALSHSNILSIHDVGDVKGVRFAVMELLEGQTVRERLIAMLAAFFAVVSLLLAGVGLYAVLNYSVLQRRREIGIRMAIGSTRAGIVRIVTLNIFLMIALGGCAGVALGFGAARYVESLFYQVKATDADMIASPTCAILLTALVATLPAVLRALRTDPTEILRSE